MSDAYSSLSTPAGHRSSGTESRRSVEAPLTLTDKPPRTLGAGAQTAMWASFGVTLFGPLTGALGTQSVGSLVDGLAACALGTLVGALLLGGAAGIGAHTGTPSMVGLRGLLGRGASVVPTVLNIAQNIGWAMMEIIVITSAATHIVGAAWHWPFVIVAGALCTLMAIRPLGSVKILRTVMLWLVLAGSIYLFVMVLRQPSHTIGQDTVIGFWPGVDLAAAQVVSFAPLAADYSRHATSGRSAFASSATGYGLAIFAYYALGVFAVAPLGGALAGTNLLAVHNLAPRLDRRVISVAVGVVATVLAGLAGFDQYEGFLYLIGSAFVPLFTVAVVDFFVTRRGRWDTTATAPFRWSPTLA
ncbi:MAG: permease [Propionibacterium sp.]|nr:permease [Propionibacterium sp.]